MNDTTLLEPNDLGDLDQYRAVTLWRPWPELIFAAPELLAGLGPKDVENRRTLHATPGTAGWNGQLIIHAGRKWDETAASIASGEGLRIRPQDSEPGYVGLVTVTDVHHGDQGTCLCTSWWAEPRVWHWCLTNPRRFTWVVPLPGQRGLFKPHSIVVEELPSLLDKGA